MARRPTNDRGFGEYLDRCDSKGQRFRVVESSSAEVNAVWIFTDQKTGVHLGRDMHAALHLDAESARALIGALHEWMDYQSIRRDANALNNQPDRRGSKPTIAELEAILRDGGAQIEVLPNGEVRALNPVHSQHSDGGVSEPNTDISRRVGDGRRRNE